MTRHARFEIVSDSAEQLVIRDVGRGSVLSVTNDVEWVVESLYDRGLLREGKRLLYYDSCGDLDEIIHCDGRFDGFAPGPNRPADFVFMW